jgi:hypothetical protein
MLYTTVLPLGTEEADVRVFETDMAGGETVTLALLEELTGNDELNPIAEALAVFVLKPPGTVLICTESVMVSDAPTPRVCVPRSRSVFPEPLNPGQLAVSVPVVATEVTK